jgi:hypothetical protein
MLATRGCECVNERVRADRYFMTASRIGSSAKVNKVSQGHWIMAVSYLREVLGQAL